MPAKMRLEQHPEGPNDGPEHHEHRLGQQAHRAPKAGWRPVEEEADADMRAPPPGDDPARTGQPDHQEARTLVRPGQRLVERPGDDAEQHRAEQRDEQRAADHDQRQVEQPDGAGGAA